MVLKCPEHKQRKGAFICMVSPHLRKVSVTSLCSARLAGPFDSCYCSSCLLSGLFDHSGHSWTARSSCLLALGSYSTVGGFSPIWLLLKDNEWQDVSSHSTTYVTDKRKKIRLKVCSVNQWDFQTKNKSLFPVSQDKDDSAKPIKSNSIKTHEFEQVLGDGEGQGSLVCCSPWDRKEPDTTEQLNNNDQENESMGRMLFLG